MSKQEPPFTIKIEFSEGCNLRCSFCGINGIRSKERTYKFLSLPNAKKIAENILQSGWNSKIECAMHGEPLMNPNHVKLIKLFKTILPDNQLMVSTNSLPLLVGDGGIVHNVIELFDNGLDILVVDCYDVAEKAWSVIKAHDFSGTGIEKTEYPGGPSPNKKFKKGDKRIILIEDLAHAQSEDEVSGGRLGNRIISNHIGAAFPVSNLLPMNKRCARPFRELSIRWNGKVALCCNDWRGEYKCGSVLDEDIVYVWNNKYFESARRMLYDSDRGFAPCNKCDNISFRVGLLPDKLGKKTMPLPNRTTRKYVEEAVSGRSYTSPILRPWEEKK